MAIRLNDLGWNGSPSTSTTRPYWRGGRPDGSASTRSPGWPSPGSLIARSVRAFLSTGASRQPNASLRKMPSTNSSDFASAFIGNASSPPPCSSIRASSRSPRPNTARRRGSITRRRGGGVACSHLSGTAIATPSATSQMRITVTLGRPPPLCRLRPGPVSSSPASIISLSSAFKAILSCACRPNALAISRLPTLVFWVAMKSRMACRSGRPARALLCGLLRGVRGMGLPWAFGPGGASAPIVSKAAAAHMRPHAIHGRSVRPTAG